MRVVKLVPVKPKDAIKIYNWLYHSNFSEFLSGLEGYTPQTLPTFTQFKEDYEDYFFDGSRPESGMCLLIYELKTCEEVGVISYSSSHLLSGIAELDIWLKSLNVTGRGLGTEAVKELARKAFYELGFHTLIMRPSKLNKRAIRSYQKAGFRAGRADPVHLSQFRPSRWQSRSGLQTTL